MYYFQSFQFIFSTKIKVNFFNKIILKKLFFRFLPKKSNSRPIVSYKEKKTSKILNDIESVNAVLDFITAENPSILGLGLKSLLTILWL